MIIDPNLIVLKIYDTPTGGISNLEIHVQYDGEILPGFFKYETMRPLHPDEAL